MCQRKKSKPVRHEIWIDNSIKSFAAKKAKLLSKVHATENK